MKIFGIYILTDVSLKKELKRRNDFDASQVKFLLKDNLRLRGIIEKPLGSFYDCRGGWARQNEYYGNVPNTGGDRNDKSLIVRISEEKKLEPSPGSHA